MFLNDYGLEKAKSLKEGDMVSWNSSGGRARGKVIHVMDYGTLDIPNTKFKIKGEKDNPAVLIQLYRDGKETDIQVGHKMSSLTKSLDEPLLKHGSHNQKTHAGSRGSGGGSATSDDGNSKEKKIKDDIQNLTAKSNEMWEAMDERLEEDMENDDITDDDYSRGTEVLSNIADAEQMLDNATNPSTSPAERLRGLERASQTFSDAARKLRNTRIGNAGDIDSLADDVDAIIDEILGRN